MIGREHFVMLLHSSRRELVEAMLPTQALVIALESGTFAMPVRLWL